MKKLFFITIIIILILMFPAKILAQETPAPTPDNPNEQPSDNGSNNGVDCENLPISTECQRKLRELESHMGKIKELTKYIGFHPTEVWKHSEDWQGALKRIAIGSFCPSPIPGAGALVALASLMGGCLTNPAEKEQREQEAKKIIKVYKSFITAFTKGPGAAMLDQSMESLGEINFQGEKKKASEVVYEIIHKEDEWFPTKKGLELLTQLKNELEATENVYQDLKQNCSQEFEGGDFQACVPYYGREGNQSFNNWDDFQNHLENVLHLAPLAAETHGDDEDVTGPWWRDVLRNLAKIVQRIIVTLFDTLINLLIIIVGAS